MCPWEANSSAPVLPAAVFRSRPICVTTAYQQAFASAAAPRRDRSVPPASRLIKHQQLLRLNVKRLCNAVQCTQGHGIAGGRFNVTDGGVAQPALFGQLLLAQVGLSPEILHAIPNILQKLSLARCICWTVHCRYHSSRYLSIWYRIFCCV